MRLILLLSSFFTIIFLYAGILNAINRPRAIMQQRITRLFSKQITLSDEELNQIQANRDMESEKTKSLKERIVIPLWAMFRTRFVKTLSPQIMNRLEIKLRDAGYPLQMSPLDFRALQVIFGFGFFLLIIGMFLSVAQNKTDIITLGAIAGGFGYIYPELYLKSKKRQRYEMIQKSMPDFFDMVNVSIEAGMGLDAALTKVCKQLGGPIGQEFLQTLDEMRLGKSRREAFSGLRERIAVETFQSVMSALIQADQLGIGMAKVIRAQTRRIREHQRQKAKEQAMKAPIKMMFPLVLFIFPTLFIVLLGPILILLMKNLF